MATKPSKTNKPAARRSTRDSDDKPKLTATTPVGTACFVHLWEPSEGLDGQDSYGLVLVFTEDTDLKDLKKICGRAAAAKFGERKVREWMKQESFKLPFRNAEDYGKYGEPFVEGNTFLNLRSNSAPGIVDRYKDRKTGKARVITDEGEVYAGSQIRCTVYAHAFDTRGNKGVTFLLNNVQKWDEGERLAGRSAAADDFEAEEAEDAGITDDGDSIFD